MSFPGFPKKSKLSSINFCFEILDCHKNGVSVYLVPRKCQYLRSGLTDFRFKSRFGNVNKFYKRLLNTWMRFDHEICIKKSPEVDGRSKTNFRSNFKLWLTVHSFHLINFRKFCEWKGADRIWLKLVWDTWDHPSFIPSLVFFDNFFRPKIASREPCIGLTLEIWKFSSNKSIKIFYFLVQGWPTRGPERHFCGPILDWNSDCFFTFFVEIWPKESIFL
jgi:hypothetical protein